MVGPVSSRSHRAGAACRRVGRSLLLLGLSGMFAVTGARAADPAPRAMTVLFSVVADSPRVRLCDGGRSMPVAREGDYAALERAYERAAPAPGLSVAARVVAAVVPRDAAGGAAARASEPALVIERFVTIRPGAGCGAAAADGADLAGIDWQLVWSADGAGGAAAQRRPPQLRFDVENQRLSGADGCNRIGGGFELQGHVLSIESLMGTRRACLPDVTAQVDAFHAALERVAAYIVREGRLELLDARGEPILRFEPVR